MLAMKMPRSFKDVLAYDETLFKDARVFDLDYIPKDFNYRDAQLRSIYMCLKPAAQGGRPINARVFGPPATGKTTAVKLAFKDAEETTDKLTCAHINCQIHSSKFAVFSQIHKKVVGHLPPETGVPFQKVYEAIFKRLEKEGKSLVVALDDMNYLFYDRYANELLYDLLRAHEVFAGARTAVFGILSDIDFNYKLDQRVVTMFRPQEIFFQPYSYDETLEILRARAEQGLYPGVAPVKVLEKIAEYAHAHADLRAGIEMLRRSASIAELDASRVIKLEHVEKAYEQSKSLNLQMLLKSLAPEEKELMKIIAESREDGADSGELYEIFKKRTKQSYTSFYRILDKFEALRLLDTKYASKGERGRTRNIFLRYSREEILAAVKGK